MEDDAGLGNGGLGRLAGMKLRHSNTVETHGIEWRHLVQNGDKWYRMERHNWDNADCIKVHDDVIMIALQHK